MNAGGGGGGKRGESGAKVNMKPHTKPPTHKQRNATEKKIFAFLNNVCLSQILQGRKCFPSRNEQGTISDIAAKISRKTTWGNGRGCINLVLLA